MATTEDSIEFEKIPPATAQTGQQKQLPPGSTRFDWIVTLLCTLLIGGVFLDGWAHNHGKVDSTFFTPWHAALYSGYALGAAFLFFSLVRSHAKGYPWQPDTPHTGARGCPDAHRSCACSVGTLPWRWRVQVAPTPTCRSFHYASAINIHILHSVCSSAGQYLGGSQRAWIDKCAE